MIGLTRTNGERCVLDPGTVQRVEGHPGTVVFLIDGAKYVVNVWSQNNSPAAAGGAGIVKKGSILMVRGIAGNPVEQAFQDAAMQDIKACPGLKVVGTIWGKWTNATGTRSSM